MINFSKLWTVKKCWWEIILTVNCMNGKMLISSLAEIFFENLIENFSMKTLRSKTSLTSFFLFYFSSFSLFVVDVLSVKNSERNSNFPPSRNHFFGFRIPLLRNWIITKLNRYSVALFFFCHSICGYEHQARNLARGKRSFHQKKYSTQKDLRFNDRKQFSSKFK